MAGYDSGLDYYERNFGFRSAWLHDGWTWGTGLHYTRLHIMDEALALALAARSSLMRNEMHDISSLIVVSIFTVLIFSLNPLVLCESPSTYPTQHSDQRTTCHH